ncbi:MAG: transporter substrate-binding protein [Polaromonas sp.]|nr:transporter substrate-binding protein [Polaromonas sp.]
MLRRRFLSLAPQLTAASFAPAFIRNAYAQDGLSAKSVTIGSSGALTGPLSGSGASVKVGVDAAMAQINAKGGINGRQLQFQQVDDAYVPQRTAENVRKMIGDGSVFALLTCIGTPNNAAIMPMIQEANLPYVGPRTGAASLRKAGMRNVFHVRASYTEETQRLVQQLLSMGIKNLAIVYLDNAFGKEVLADAVTALQALGVKPVVQTALAVDGSNLAAVVNQTMAGKPAAVFLATAGDASANLIVALKKASPMMSLAGLSVTLTAEGLRGLGAAGAGLAMTMVFPDPNRARNAMVRDYQSAMRAIGQQEFSPDTLESYINTRVLAEGLERAGRDLTRAKLQAALASLQRFDLGGFSIDYTAAAPFVGSHYVDLGVLGTTGRYVG